MPRYVSVVVGGMLLLAAVEAALAQPTAQQWQQQLQRLRQQGQAPNIQWENAELSGTIKGLQGSLIQLAASGGENWIVQVEARPQDVSFQGTADPAFVKVGMLVEFKSKLTKRGHAVEPVNQLAIFSVREGRGVGVLADGVGGRGEAGLFESKPEGDDKKAPKGREDETVYRVAGQITKLSRGEMTLNCAGTTIKADLDKEAKITLEVNHLQWAQLGDKIDLRARYPMGQKAAGQALASQVTVTGASLLGEPKKRILPGKSPTDQASEEAKDETPK